MATTVSLLNSLTDAITSATTAFPTDTSVLLPPPNGISLLDAKNELLLSYLQNLAFLILLRLKSLKKEENSTDIGNTNEEVTQKLVELRVLLERGVRPLEGKLRYQIDKVLRAADDAERINSRRTSKAKQKKSNGISTRAGSDISDAVSESNDDSEAQSDDDDDDEEAQELMHRPNAAALIKQVRQDQDKTTKSRSSNSGAYKPPRITPTAMPTTSSKRERDNDQPARRRKSNLVDEYIDEEMSSAPRAQPSIGSNSTILDRGRGGLSDRDRQKQRERTEYEEANFMRLPIESKAERRKAKARGERERRDMFGGEDWTGLGGLGDRINRTVSGKGGTSVLERREKRKRATEDGPRGDGMGIGDAFERRKKILGDRADRKRQRKG